MATTAQQATRFTLLLGVSLEIRQVKLGSLRSAVQSKVTPVAFHHGSSPVCCTRAEDPPVRAIHTEEGICERWADEWKRSPVGKFEVPQGQSQQHRMLAFLLASS